MLVGVCVRCCGCVYGVVGVCRCCGCVYGVGVCTVLCVCIGFVCGHGIV